MKVIFTDLIKASSYKHKNFKKKIIKGFSKLISNNQFIGGKEVLKFENKFSKYVNIKNCITVGNGTDALEIALESLSLPKGTEVIIPVNTWISTAEAISRNNLKVVFCDINLNDYSMDLIDLEKKISKKTSAIIVVHLYGFPSNLNGIKKLIKNKKIKIIEDCAQAHGTKFFKKHVGTFGHIGAFSFFPSKNLGAFGDAGAIITNNKALADKCRRLRNHGSLKKYDHKFVGRNSRLDSLQSFVLSEKIKFFKNKMKKRNLLAKIYLKKLKNLDDLHLPVLDFKNNYNTFHQFVIRVKKKRNELIRYLHKANIETMIHYPYMLNDLKFYKNCKGVKTLINSRDLGKKILSLPISEEHTINEIEHICEKIKSFYKKNYL